MLELREIDDSVTLRVRVQPRASRDGLQGERDGALVVRLQAPPVEGAANDALQRLLARALGVAPSRVELVRGANGRDKLVRLRGLRACAVRALLEAGPDRGVPRAPRAPTLLPARP